MHVCPLEEVEASVRTPACHFESLSRWYHRWHCIGHLYELSLSSTMHRCGMYLKTPTSPPPPP